MVIVVGLIALSIFALANWTVLIAPTSLSFIAFTVEGPLGAILLGVTLLFLALFVAYALALRTSMLIEAHRHVKELQVQRDLAEKAEVSRLESMRVQMEDGFTQSRAAITETTTSYIDRVSNVEQSLRKSLEETMNALSAHLGEIEDKLDRVLQRKSN